MLRSYVIIQQHMHIFCGVFNLSQPIFVFELQGSSCSIKVKHGDHVIDVIYGCY